MFYYIKQIMLIQYIYIYIEIKFTRKTFQKKTLFKQVTYSLTYSIVFRMAFPYVANYKL